jgi:uncharacterized protein YcgL (UPF0745 family)
MTKLELMKKIANGEDLGNIVKKAFDEKKLLLEIDNLSTEYDSLVKELYADYSDEINTTLYKKNARSKKLHKKDIEDFYNLIEKTLKDNGYDYFLDAHDTKKINVKIASGNNIDTSDVVCVVKLSTRRFFTYKYINKKTNNIINVYANDYEAAKKINEIEAKILHIDKKLHNCDLVENKLDKINSLLDNLSEILD